MPIFKKVLVANRGEIAVRIIRACKELGIKTVAIYSDVDKESIHVRLADESVCIGPANVTDSYLNVPSILSAADITDAEAIHPGYGFLSENTQFAEACMSSEIVFIGPTPENINLAGNKAKSKQILKKKGIPVIPGSDGVVHDKKTALKAANKVGFPVIIKAASGGGGKGMRLVDDKSKLEQAFTVAQRESLASFGYGAVYVEKYMSKIRHVEVQIIVDSKGRIVHLGERDCSVQRRHQKLIEESPSPVFSIKLRRKIGDYAVKAARALQYRNIGTFEFIVDEKEHCYLLEINTRVQVEHPVTEMVTGIDIIKEQIKISSGLPLELKQENISLSGHSIECRINAEDPESFVPSPGKVSFYFQPGGPGIRVDTSVYSGYTIPPYYDSLIAKIISYGSNRKEAIERMLRALDEFKIDGIKTTIPFHKRVLTNPDFISGNFDTTFLEKINNNNALS